MSFINTSLHIYPFFLITIIKISMIKKTSEKFVSYKKKIKVVKNKVKFIENKELISILFTTDFCINCPVSLNSMTTNTDYSYQ